MGSNHDLVKPTTIKLVCVASLPSTHPVYRRTSKDWFARNHNNVAVSNHEWTVVSVRLLYANATSRVGLVQIQIACWSSTNLTSRVGLVQIN